MSTLFSKPKMPQKSEDQLIAERSQADEIKRLKREESARKAALVRGQGGRASLISGSERGISAGTKDTLG